MTTDSNPDIIITLVAHGHRAHDVWADPQNESFYLPPLSQANNGGPREVVVSPDDCFRALTPSPDEPGLIKASEPALQITFSKKPKNPGLGYVLGSDRENCDIFLGSTDDLISHQIFAISFNQYNEVIMETSSRNGTVVTYGTQIAKRKNFTWIFPPGQKSIFVNAAETIKFTVEVPTHETDKAVYGANCRNFMTLANSTNLTMNLLNFSSRPDTGLASGAATRHATTEPPFYLQIGKLGKGGCGAVYKARAMPGGATVAVKTFKAKTVGALEVGVLRKLSETPHENIVQLINYKLGDRPYLVMGVALGGNVEEQYKSLPFTTREIGLILRQMLDALVYLHDGFNITHRDVKPANILCDSRSHFRLADFGCAKEGNIIKRVGTQPYMAPEMFSNRRYTAAVDVWALGMVIAQLLSHNGPPGYKGNEGPGWSTAVVANFNKYIECCQAIGSNAVELIGLNRLVGQYMLRMKPEDRESASGCLGQGKSLWLLSDQDSEDGAKTPTREDPTRSFPGGTLNEEGGASDEKI